MKYFRISHLDNVKTLYGPSAVRKNTTCIRCQNALAARVAGTRRGLEMRKRWSL